MACSAWRHHTSRPRVLAMVWANRCGISSARSENSSGRARSSASICVSVSEVWRPRSSRTLVRYSEESEEVFINRNTQVKLMSFTDTSYYICTFSTSPPAHWSPPAQAPKHQPVWIPTQVCDKLLGAMWRQLWDLQHFLPKHMHCATCHWLQPQVSQVLGRLCYITPVKHAI